MRYAPAQKAETREKLVREAAARMRSHGPDGVGVADIMRGIGLTHGGFYAHFESKDDLIAQAVAQMFTESAARYARLLEGMPQTERLPAFVGRYVSAAHRDRPDRGCPLTTITADITRQSAAARAAFDAGVAAITGCIDAMLPGPPGPRRMARAASILSEMAGAVALSRAVSDSAASDRILAATAANVLARGLATDEPEGETP
jgi:TetR/AcrR family transcriptional repressor of nem operon